MRIALIGTEHYAIEQVRNDLRGRGHVTIPCYEAHRGDTDGTDCACAHGVDVLLDVRAHPLAHITAQEQRALACPMLADVPLVVAGCPTPNPFGERAAVTTFGLDTVEQACADAAASTSLVGSTSLMTIERKSRD